MVSRKTITLADPTPERQKKPDFGKRDEEHDIGTGDGRVTLVSPLERCWRREIISGRQYAAGNEYRLCVHLCGFAGLSSSGDMSKVWGTGINWDLLPKTEGAVENRQKYRAAVQAMGQIYAPVVDSVVLYEKTLEETGLQLGVPQQREAITVAKYMFRAGLDRLAGVFKA